MLRVGMKKPFKKENYASLKELTESVCQDHMSMSKSLSTYVCTNDIEYSQDIEYSPLSVCQPYLKVQITFYIRIYE